MGLRKIQTNSTRLVSKRVRVSVVSILKVLKVFQFYIGINHIFVSELC